MNIIIDLQNAIYDGMELKFRSPVDCSQVTGLKVYYNNKQASMEFAFADAHGNNVGDIDHLFAENVVVKVILDITSGMAFVQNADTNTYLEKRFDGLSDSIVCDSSGEVITVTDSANRPLQNLVLSGKTTQKTYTGKNKLPSPYDSTTKTVNGVTFTDNGDGTITVNGTATAFTRYTIKTMYTIEPGTYILSGCPSGGSSSTYYIELLGVIGDSMEEYETGNGLTINMTQDSFIDSLFIRIENGTKLSNAVFKPMIRLASVTDASWEPYTGGIPAPNPGYHVPLESVGDSGSMGVTVAGKNLLKSMRAPGYSITSNGVTFTVQEDGTITTKGAPIDTTAFCQCIFTQYVEHRFYLPAGTYTISSGLSDRSGYFMVTLREPTSSVDEKSFYAYNTPITFTLDTPKIIWSCVRVSRDVGNATVGLVFKPQIEIGDTATVYEPYKAPQTLTIQTPNGLHGIGEVKDEIDGKNSVRTQRIYEKVFDGTEACETYAPTVTNGVLFRLNPYISHEYRASSKCSHFTFNTYGWDSQANRQFKTIYPDYCVFRHDDYPTPDAFKTWLAQQYANGTPVKVQYVLETPIETPLSAEEMLQYSTLHTNKPNTTVFNDAGAEMGVSYVVDTKAYIDNKFTELKNAILATGANI